MQYPTHHYLEQNASVYVAGHVCKMIFRDHQCLSFEKMLLHDSTRDVDIGNKYLEFKVYKHCTTASLHTPSNALLLLLTEC